MCNLAKLYEQVLQVTALAREPLAVHLNASVNASGPYYSVGVSASAHAAQGALLGPEVARASATTADELLANLARALNVANPCAPPQPALAAQKEEIIRLLNNPLITRQEKTYTLLRINRMGEEEAKLTIEDLGSRIERRENGTVSAAA